jgi:hypothetical protein
MAALQAPVRGRPLFGRNRAAFAPRRGPFACCRTTRGVGAVIGDSQAARPTVTGPRSDICRDVPVGTLLPFGLTLTQDRETASGTATLDDVVGPVQGSIRPAGQLGVGGTFTFTDEGVTIDVTVTDWETTTTDNQRMTGRFAVVFRAARLQGSVRFDGELRIVAKSAAASVPAAPGQYRLRRLLTAVTRR